MASARFDGKATKKNACNISTKKGKSMKVMTELALIRGVTLAVVLAVFLLNFWLVHHIELLVGAKVTWYIIGIGAVMATGWVFGRGAKK